MSPGLWNTAAFINIGLLFSLFYNTSYEIIVLRNLIYLFIIFHKINITSNAKGVAHFQHKNSTCMNKY